MFPVLNVAAYKSLKAAHRKKCFDCGKSTMPHNPSADGLYCCCFCFYYWVKNDLWRKVTGKIPDGSGKWNGMLCLHCFAKRLDRQMKKSDFSEGQYGFFDPKLGDIKGYIKFMRDYANSGENTSIFL